MKKFLVSAFVGAVVAAAGVAPAFATVLNFDDLNTGGAGAVASSYAGFTFNNWWHIDSPPYGYPTQSFPTVIYNSESSYTNTPEILFGSSMDVLSVYLADFNSGSVTLRGFSGATELYTLNFALTGSMQQYNLNFMGIDRFVMQTTAGTTYVFMDDLELDSAVPEPAALSLVGLGLLGVALARRQKAKA